MTPHLYTIGNYDKLHHWHTNYITLHLTTSDKVAMIPKLSEVKW
jgi:hypothetical protein